MYVIEKIKTEILLALKTALGKDYSPTEGDLEKPKDPKLGDVAFPCFRLAKGMQRNPAEISREIAAKVAPKGFIKEVRAVGPYVNFILEPNAVFNELHKQVGLLGKKYGEGSAQKRKLMFEYSGLNTHKPVHIGHLRNIILGSALVRLMRAEGVNVIAADFVNDLGLHVAQWLWGYQKFHAGEKPPRSPAKWIAGIYTEAVSKYEADEANQKEVRAVLQKLQDKDRPTMRLWKKTRAWSLKEFKTVHKELGAEFDVFYAESEVAGERLEIVRKLVERGIARVSQGATIVDLEDVGLGIFVILRSDGTALYSTTDLALALKKFRDKKIDASYITTDARQKLQFAQLFETLKRYGVPQEMKHIPYEFVTLPEGAMSSRKGTVILYEDFRDELVNYAIAETKKRHEGWSARKIRKTAEAVAFGALKFDMLKQDPDKPIVFDVKEALSFDGFSAPYLQYTLARVAGIMKKTPKPGRTSKPAAVTNESERRILLELARYPEVVREAYVALKPSTLAHYLFGIAKLFADFYEHVPVARSSEGERALHLSVLKDLVQVMENGLKLLGIPSVKQM